jgi:hypothetical protein
VDTLLSIVAGLIVFWVLFAVFTWILNTALDAWPLVLFFVLHWLIYWAGWKEAMAFPSTTWTTAGWFVLGPVLGGIWLALRTIYAVPNLSAGASPDQTEEPEELAPIPPAKKFMVAVTLGVLEFLLVSGALLPIFLGLIYVALKWFHFVP